MIDGYTIRPATLADAGIIQGHRRAMFADMKYSDVAALDAMSERFLPWVRRKMEAGEYLAWLAIAPDSSIAAGTGVWLMDWPSHMVGPGAPVATVLNFYTPPLLRSRGLASVVGVT
jgi:hypothetical protein